MNKLFYYTCVALLASSTMFTVSSCADKELDSNSVAEGKDAMVNFTVNDVQKTIISRGARTRGEITPGLSAADLVGAKLAATNNNELCLVETTVEGINPSKADARTRATIIKTETLGDFSTSGVRGTSATSLTTGTEWFHAVKTKNTGELYSPIYWSIEQPSARFFAIYPEKTAYPEMTINNTDDSKRPNIDFQVKENVKDQVDLMTACTGDVLYATRGVHPTTNLNFRHALTAIRFAVGQNLSWNKTIDRIEIRNAIVKSKYYLPTDLNGSDANWVHTESSENRGSVFLVPENVTTSEAPNSIITGKEDDNYTFYMIPQELNGKNVKVYVHFTDNTEIEVPLKGRWNAGTTRTYKLSQTNSSWNYVITGEDPIRPANFYENTSQSYYITSYREDPNTQEKQAVAWKVVGYDADGDGTFDMTEKPAWLKSLSSESGNGDANDTEACTAELTVEAKDIRAERNNLLKNAQELGSAAQPYDLSTKGGTEPRTTANAYLISSPGHYRIPLVYGNAVKNGKTNTRAYINHTHSENDFMQRYILSNFLDHAGAPISDPWIEKTNSGANAGINGAYLVWADEKPLADIQSSLTVKHEAGSEAFLDFTVTKDNIESGNAVVAVTKDGTTLWSWHLWFAPEDALEKVTVTNHDNDDFDFSKETLGWNPTDWMDASYSQPRTVKVKFEQTIANNGIKQFTVINITQKPGIRRFGVSTLYQFGRKDAFPSVLLRSQIYGGHFDYNKDNAITISKAIQHPGTIYKGNDIDDENNTWYRSPDEGGYTYLNLWAANNGSTSIEMTDRPIKTVYDPCPAGFCIPTPAAFTGFTTTGYNTRKPSEWNVDDTSQEAFIRDFGFNFWTNKDHNQKLFIPAIGSRRYSSGIMNEMGSRGKYWTAATHYQHDQVFAFDFYNSNDAEVYSIPIIYTSHLSRRSFSIPVRPVAEK